MEDGEKSEPFHIASGNKKFGKSLAVPSKIKQLSAIPFQDICPGEMKTGMHRRMYMNVHSNGAIHSSPSRRQPSTHQQVMDEHSMVHPHSRILISIFLKMEGGSDTCYIMDWTLGDVMLSERRDTEE